MVNSGDNREYEHRTRQGRWEGLFYLGCIVFAVAIGFMVRGWL